MPLAMNIVITYFDPVQCTRDDNDVDDFYQERIMMVMRKIIMCSCFYHGNNFVSELTDKYGTSIS